MSRAPSDGPAPSTLQARASSAPSVVALQRLQRVADASAQNRLLASVQRLADDRAPAGIDTTRVAERKAMHVGGIEPLQRAAMPDEEELVQGRFAEPLQRAAMEEDELLQGRFAEPVQRQTSGRGNGLPADLQRGLEAVSGIEMSDVRVHYNSSEPAQMAAHAFTQGADIHVGPGQERHLPHEAWHAVQQRQGRVEPTGTVNEQPLNDDVALEQEADRMGARAQSEGVQQRRRRD